MKYLILISFCVPIGLIFVYAIKTVALKLYGISIIMSINFLNILLEIKIYKISKIVYEKTRGSISLNGRYEMFSNIKLLKCFIPASIVGIIFKIVIYILAYMKVLGFITYEPRKFYFLFNLLWNIDCSIFPWFFLVTYKPIRKILHIFDSQTNYYYCI
ncbi:unnamed protein product [Caenorhabditis angaria]|uniref:Uncharacterized protein n=1 Tax=Caenorhabditis angaria TaxID=860376 RepID=A0A9P1ITR9_9PELO|nr:unnamed protein product [Caenorhabditis angaria]